MWVSWQKCFIPIEKLLSMCRKRYWIIARVLLSPSKFCLSWKSNNSRIIQNWGWWFGYGTVPLIAVVALNSLLIAFNTSFIMMKTDIMLLGNEEDDYIGEKTVGCLYQNVQRLKIVITAPISVIRTARDFYPSELISFTAVLCTRIFTHAPPTNEIRGLHGPPDSFSPTVSFMSWILYVHPNDMVRYETINWTCNRTSIIGDDIFIRNIVGAVLQGDIASTIIRDALIFEIEIWHSLAE